MKGREVDIQILILINERRGVLSFSLSLSLSFIIFP